jgi:hypothetical protein
MTDLSLVRRLDRLERDPPLRVCDVDFQIRDPEGLRREFDEVFWYIATVEGAVGQNVADVTSLLPDLDGTDRHFLEVWAEHEAGHFRIFQALRHQLHHQVVEAPEPTRRWSLRLAGSVAELPWLRQVFKLVYLARGAMHEHLTYSAYLHLGRLFRERGEWALAATVTDPVRRQEAAHLGYYRLAAIQHRQGMTPAQVAVARAVSVRSYLPIGAVPCGRAASGRVFHQLVGRQRMDQVLDPVEALGQLLLGDTGQPLPTFVHRAMYRCFDEGGLPEPVGPGAPG